MVDYSNGDLESIRRIVVVFENNVVNGSGETLLTNRRSSNEAEYNELIFDRKSNLFVLPFLDVLLVFFYFKPEVELSGDFKSLLGLYYRIIILLLRG